MPQWDFYPLSDRKQPLHRQWNTQGPVGSHAYVGAIFDRETVILTKVDANAAPMSLTLSFSDLDELIRVYQLQQHLEGTE